LQPTLTLIKSLQRIKTLTKPLKQFAVILKQRMKIFVKLVQPFANYIILLQKMKNSWKPVMKLLNMPMFTPKKIGPFSKQTVGSIQDFMENYTSMDFEEFKEEIDGLAKDAFRQKEEALYIMILHMQIQGDFKREQGKIDLKISENELEKQAETIKITDMQDQNSPTEKIETTEIQDLINKIKSPIDKFVNALEKLTGFFSVLSNELGMLTGTIEGLDKVEIKNRHYKKCRSKAMGIIGYCKDYISESIVCVVDIRVIENDLVKNHAKKWLSVNSVDANDMKKISIEKM